MVAKQREIFCKILPKPNLVESETVVFFFSLSVDSRCYDSAMTTVDILFRYAAAPTESQALALANARDVYGIRRISFDREAHTLRVEYDATRLNAAMVTQLVRRAGIQIAEELSLIPPPSPAPEPAPAV
jgi:hypothetical protein